MNKLSGKDKPLEEQNELRIVQSEQVKCCIDKRLCMEQKYILGPHDLSFLLFFSFIGEIKTQLQVFFNKYQNLPTDANCL